MSDDLMELVNDCGTVKAPAGDKVTEATETALLLAELGFTVAASNVEKQLRPAIRKAGIAAGGYLEITPQKILAFLERKAAAYNRKSFKDLKRSAVADGFREHSIMDLYNHALSYRAARAGAAGAGQALWFSSNANTYSAPFGQQQDVPLSPQLQQLAQQLVPPKVYEVRTKDYMSAREDAIGRFVWMEVPVATYPGIPPTSVLLKLKEIQEKKVFDSFTVATVNAVRDPLLLGRIDDCESRYYLAQWGDDVSLDEVI